jgi:hypothetical protein
MSEIEKLVLSDQSVIPTDEYIFSLIGERKPYWLSIMTYASENYNDTGSWNYYRDGKQWLYKLVNKKKTIFWAGILSDTFRITFYFGDKAEPILVASDLPEKMKSDFNSAKRYGAIRAVTILIKDRTDVDNVLKLVNIKHKIK